MPASYRKPTLFAHIISTSAWIGSVFAFLLLALVGLYGNHPQVYPAMELMTTWIILPVAFLSLGTGILLSLVTSWGLTRHYWVIAKLLINALSLPLLLLHTRMIRMVGARGALSFTDLRPERTHIVVAAAAALGALLLATFLSVYKPKGGPFVSFS